MREPEIRTNFEKEDEFGIGLILKSNLKVIKMSAF
jgi:hypothetical protein